MLKNNLRNYSIITGTLTKDDSSDSKVIINESGQIDKLKLFAYCKNLIKILNFKYQDEATLACVNEYKDDGEKIFK